MSHSQNIRVVAGYYTRITLARLSEFLSLPVAETEQFLARLVVSKTVFAKIDRPAGLVSFVKPKTGDEVLNEWSSDVHKLMGLIEKSCHLIAKVRCSSSFRFFSHSWLTGRRRAGARRARRAQGQAGKSMSVNGIAACNVVIFQHAFVSALGVSTRGWHLGIVCTHEAVKHPHADTVHPCLSLQAKLEKVAAARTGLLVDCVSPGLSD